MEVITIESKAFAALMEKIETIGQYVEESRQKEVEQQQGQGEKNRRKADKWMTGQEVCEYLEVGIRTLQRYRAIGMLSYFTISGKVFYRAKDVHEFLRTRLW